MDAGCDHPMPQCSRAVTAPGTSQPLGIIPGLSVDVDELWFTYSRSGGPGGQNVNKVNTRVTLRFDVAGCGSLTDGQKRRIRSRLATRVTRDGILMVVASRHRTQFANRRAAMERFVELLRDALKTQKVRRERTVSLSAKRRRLEEKRRRTETKRLRSRVSDA